MVQNPAGLNCFGFGSCWVAGLLKMASGITESPCTLICWSFRMFAPPWLECECSRARTSAVQLPDSRGFTAWMATLLAHWTRQAEMRTFWWDTRNWFPTASQTWVLTLKNPMILGGGGQETLDWKLSLERSLIVCRCVSYHAWPARLPLPVAVDMWTEGAQSSEFPASFASFECFMGNQSVWGLPPLVFCSGSVLLTANREGKLLWLRGAERKLPVFM